VTASKRRAGFDLRIAIMAAVVLLLALGGAVAWAMTTSNDLQATTTTLAATRGDLDTTRSTLADRSAELESTAADLAQTEEAIKADEDRITVLEFQIERKGACIEAQATNLAEIRRILALERENFARTTSGSSWGMAHAASKKAINLAIDDLYKAYTSAAAGNYGTANSWLEKSNAQIRVSNKQLDALDREIDAINASSDAINAANDGFQNTLDETLSTCGG
jgi:septal ring factor EnvC (AmiA/AmiB activator)